MKPDPATSDAALQVTIHIGSTKTGSSALQALLFNNREALAAAGVLYPDVGIASSAHHVLLGAIHPSAWEMHRASYDIPAIDYFRRGMAEVVRRAKAQNCQRVVLSSEYLWGVFPERVYAEMQEALAGQHVDILGCVRDAAEWAEASYLQALKSGETRDFFKWYDAECEVPVRGFDQQKVLSAWQAGTAARHVTVVPYDFEDAGRFMERMFLEATGIALPGMPHQAAGDTINPSPNETGMKLLLELNRSDVPAEQRRARAAAILKEHRRPLKSRELYFLKRPDREPEREGTDAESATAVARAGLPRRAPGPGSGRRRAKAAGQELQDLSPLQFTATQPRGHEAAITAQFGVPSCIVRNHDPVLGRGCIMLFTNRSGSNYLAELLHATGAFSEFGEGLIGETVIRRARRLGLTSMGDYMTWLKRTKKGPIFGIKASAQQAAMLYRFRIIQNMFSSVDWIVMRRRDAVAQAVSLSIAQQTKVWTSRQIGNGRTAVYDFNHISKALRAVSLGDAMNLQWLSILQCGFHQVYYEDLVDSPAVALQGIRARFGLDFADPEFPDGGLKKQANQMNREFKERYLEELGSAILRG